MLKKIFLFVLFFSVCAGLWLQVLLYSENTLYRHPLWAGAKRELQMTTVGGNEFILSRASLAQNRLHLGAWWGLHGVRYRVELQPTQVIARVRLLEGAYLYVTFGDRTKSIGLRLSRSQRWKSAAVVLQENEEILHEKEISEDISAKVHEVEIRLKDHVGEIYLDGSKVDEIANPPAQGFLSFRGSFEDAQILSVHAENSKGPLLEENFRNTQLAGRVALLVVGGLILFCLVILIFSQQKFLSVLMGLLTLSLMSFSYFLFDYFTWSSVEQFATTRAMRLETDLPLSTFEKYRFAAAEKVYEWLGALPLSPDGLAEIGYPLAEYGRGPFFCLENRDCEYVPNQREAKGLADAKATGPRMLFIGTSQLAGAGADHLSDTIFARTHRYLLTHWSPHLESLNISISAGRLKEIEKFYQDSLAAFHPNLVVIDLAFNDTPEELEAGLPGLIQSFRKEGSQVVMIKEPTNNEIGFPNEDRQKKAQEIAQRFKVPFLLLHDYMNSPETIRKGLLWWDVVHMTSFGQRLAAAWLDPQILKFMQKKKALH